MRSHSPFPGMDPYLEDGGVWQDFNSALAEGIRGELNAAMGPKYYATIETHTASQDVFISLPHTIFPDVGIYTQADSAEPSGISGGATLTAPIQRVAAIEEELRFRSVRIYLAETAELITAIEILSPFNKRGEGLAEYRKKRREILKSQTHLVEIDLLRGGTRPAQELYQPPLETDYVLLVNRARNVPTRISDIWPFALNEPFPLFPIPLREPDSDIVLNLHEIFRALYPRARYGMRLNYTQPIPPPRLRPAMAEWMQTQFSLASA